MDLVLCFYIFSCFSLTVGEKTWLKFGASEFYIHRGSAVNHADAVNACALLGASLARVKTTQLHNFLVKSIGTNPPHDNFYIGLKRANLGKTGFKWNDGSSVTTGETQWLNEDPNNLNNNEYCVYMVFDVIGSNGSWYDIPCSTNGNYLCERPAGKIVEGFSVETVYSSKKYTLVAVVYKMCLSAAPYKVQARARMVDESLPHRFNVTAYDIRLMEFVARLERIDLDSGWDTSQINISWKAYFNTTVIIN
uniref:C-type lectin domain family 4 member E-like n=1 Tax=Ciona intestinalis TaxID=7719 RepID=UPI000EF49381|nr:C-type lectin domain family 4 member E-like [Ciona intestinalis]|eukprot:XP_026696212.1 C-type lectin domain family 4 member E-like [Ciona intestinalis]